ncbi:hypothetical protein MHIR_TP00034 [Candidatus Tremblaya princeps]|uniref:DUF2059 domain-containing protein n=1 Tax=Tremblaya princeps TaxID=189385 RepID=A0A143WQU0_TREPR|nr:hypothetical protein MHIR_TP00034 [Candidatus Tremblaya princeps]
MHVLILLAACLRDMAGRPAHPVVSRALALSAWSLTHRLRIRHWLPQARHRTKVRGSGRLSGGTGGSEGDWFASLVGHSLPAFARRDGPIPPRKLAAIGELMVAEGVPSMISSVVADAYRRTEQMIPLLERNILTNRNLTPSQRDRALMWMRRCVDMDVHKAACAPFAARGFWNAVIHELCMAYSRYYTTMELRDIAEFYRSTAGAKYLKHRRTVGRDVFDMLIKRCTLEHLRCLYRQIRQEASNMLGVIG